MSLDTKQVAGAIRKHPVGFACGFLVLALGVAAYFRTGTITGLEQDLADRTKQGTRQQSNVTNSVRLDEHLATLTKANEEIHNRALDSRSLGANQQYFYELEAALGVKLIDLRQGAPAPKATGATYQSIPYTVAVEGRYDQALQFVQSLERGPHYVRFISVTLQPRSGGGRPADGGAMVTLNLSLELLGKS